MDGDYIIKHQKTSSNKSEWDIIDINRESLGHIEIIMISCFENNAKMRLFDSEYNLIQEFTISIGSMLPLEIGATLVGILNRAVPQMKFRLELQ